MRQDHASRGIMMTEPRDRPVGRGTARLATFTAVALAAGSLIGAAAMLTAGDGEPKLATAPAEQTEQAAPATSVAATEPDTVETQAAEPARTAAADPTPEEPASSPTEPSAATETAATTDAATDTAPATRTLTDTQSLAARFGEPAPQADAPAQPDEALARAAADQPAEPAGTEPGGEIEVAETEAEALAIEERLSAAGAAYFELPPQADDPFEAAISDDVPLPRAFANAWVNMRAGPDNDAEILTVVPGGAEIGAEADCEGWCAVVYEGQRGYIYQSFIRR
ncbi:hypothetical protein E0E05_02550 [Roseitalea porphyridii]|uniref:SH3 domain-containing protein n=2 Tax=Roseitalea porphyridii TaxID=1852022 RepID=A0A4P6UWY9_9HYPH|nr:hypothetical protein E0E05_02550 [Roseitalea porphyridii]